MNEKLLQHIWQMGRFNRQQLFTQDNEPVHIIYPGRLNTNHGPDFLDAKIRIGNAIWVGNIELHVRSSDWEKHRHQHDSNYNNVILHVVYIYDGACSDSVPVLELKDRISRILLDRYDRLMRLWPGIACADLLIDVKEIVWRSWKDALLFQRIERRSLMLQEMLKQTSNNWEECCWRLLARNFGGHINADAFQKMAASLPLNILAKHKNQLNQLEAMLMGQAGLLDQPLEGSYPKMLQKEYRFLKHKYKLNPIHYPVHFLRMRPVNFPTVKLAQLAVLIHRSSHLFSKLKVITDIKDIYALFDITANDYWHYHYRFDEPVQYLPKKLGKQMIGNMIINSIVPLLYWYAHLHKDDLLKQRMITWLEKLPPENNTITRSWASYGVVNDNAFDSQALIELRTQYCDQKKCLSCRIGNAILK
jgi:hypothetical protein